MLPNNKYDCCGKYPKCINLNAITSPIKAEKIKFLDDTLKEINSKQDANKQRKNIIKNKIK